MIAAHWRFLKIWRHFRCTPGTYGKASVLARGAPLVSPPQQLTARALAGQMFCQLFCIVAMFCVFYCCVFVLRLELNKGRQNGGVVLEKTASSEGKGLRLLNAQRLLDCKTLENSFGQLTYARTTSCLLVSTRRFDAFFLRLVSPSPFGDSDSLIFVGSSLWLQPPALLICHVGMSEIGYPKIYSSIIVFPFSL